MQHERELLGQWLLSRRSFGRSVGRLPARVGRGQALHAPLAVKGGASPTSGARVSCELDRAQLLRRRGRARALGGTRPAFQPPSVVAEPPFLIARSKSQSFGSPRQRRRRAASPGATRAA